MSLLRFLTGSLFAVTLVGTLSVSAATAESPEPPPEPVPAETDQPIVEDALPGEIIHSWALGPAGSSNASGGGDRQNLAYSADAGTQITDAVTLYNLGNVPLTFQLYATDAFNNAEGDFALLAGSETPTGVGSWVELNQDEITLGPRLQATIPITITIPEGANPGDHTGAILASSAAVSTDAEGAAVTLDRRTGTRLFVRVNGPLTPELAVSSITTDYDNSVSPLEGSATTTYTIENRGNVRLSGVANLSIAGPLGIGEQKIPGRVFDDLLPGEELVVTETIDGVPALGYVTTTVEIVPDDTSDGAVLEPISRSARSFAPPLALLLLAAGVLFAVLTIRAIRRHRAQEAGQPTADMADREPQPV